jgi:hypothetical protein
VLRAQAVVGTLPQLSIHDGFAFALAESCPGCVLLTGDGGLRGLAIKHKMEVHGVLWVIDEIHSNGLIPTANLLAALRAFADDQTVRLPRRELLAYIKRYSASEE